MADIDSTWMRKALAIAIADKGTDPANTPIAALVVQDGRLVSSGG
ncbi:hypothetical protein ACFSTD_17895 [Novosphingobium colocasiae]